MDIFKHIFCLIPNFFCLVNFNTHDLATLDSAAVWGLCQSFPIPPSRRAESRRRLFLSLSLSEYSLGDSDITVNSVSFPNLEYLDCLHSQIWSLDSISSFSRYSLSSNARRRYYPFVCATIQVPELTTIDLNIGTDTIDHYVFVESGSTSKFGRCCRIL